MTSVNIPACFKLFLHSFILLQLRAVYAHKTLYVLIIILINIYFTTFWDFFSLFRNKETRIIF